MIQLKQVQKVYRTKRVETLALENVNLEIQQGEFVSIMGRSGCGKSTLLNIIGILDKPTSGTLYFRGNRTDTLSDKEAARLRNQKIGFIFQSFHLIAALNVFDNVSMPLLYSKISSAERKKRTHEALEMVGLAHRMQHFPAELSGGQAQRVAIARAIVGKPEVLLADEPTGNLDSKNGEDIMQIMKDLNQNHKTTLIMVTHDERLAKQTRRIIRLFDGQQVS